MLNQNQTQNQSSFQQYQQDQPRNPYPKSQRKDSNSNNPMNSKFPPNKPYQPNNEIRNNSSNRERSRSRDLSPRQSYHNYPQGNSGPNNNFNNRNNKPYHYRQNNERQFDMNMNKRDRENFSFGYNNTSYNPTRDDCLIIFQNNFFNFNSKDFIALKNELKRELKDDIYNIYYNYALSGISDKIFRFSTNPTVNYPCKSKAIKIIADFIFDIMKHQNDKVSYLKLIFVIPENVIGFIIGINGKNINQIRDETNTKIEVYTFNNTKSYRKIEIAGVPQSIADAGAKICEITRKYFNFDNEKILNRNNHSSPQRDQSWGRDRNREQYGMDFRDRNRDRERNDRYHEGHWNKDYDNGGNNKEYRGMYNRERNEFRDMGYRSREGYRNYGGRDMKNNNYNKDNNYRDFGNRYKNNNYDRGNNNRYNYDNKRNNNDFNNDKDNNDSKNRDNYSNRSFSRKSGSRYSNDNRSYNNNDNNDGEWPEDKEYKKEENKNEDLAQEHHSENNQNLEPGEAKDSDIDNNNYINDNNNANNINDKSNDYKINNENDIGVSNIENNNLDSNMNINNLAEKAKNEIGEINSILARDEEENDKLCKIIIYLSSEEINLLNNSKNENDNIWINLENSFQCSISKITKIIDEKEISLITFNGTPKQNTLAIYQLQKYLLDTKREKTDEIK